ncbi:unnamed protein product [Parnassius apollo]|uniref:(apollo) hypothetical protein n=1 Tax=Parnassius apollo TaxID=110799 RepID=A0A8S3WZI7_PARAO|nr:unnamed protein product [Parnassius apollo]
MIRLTFILVVFALFGVFGDARHIYVPEILNPDVKLTIMEPKADAEKLSIDMMRNNMNSNNGFVPMNNVIFFKTYPPCGNGFKRDVSGVCREVWD